jgi:hypothetical protein
MPDALEDADVGRLDLVEPQLAERFANHLDDALEFGAAVLVLQAGLIGLPAPRPSPDAEKAAGFGSAPSAKKFNPEKHGLRLLEAMRLTPGYDVAIGGFAQLTTVTKTSVTTRYLPGWPHEPGRIS